MNFYVLIASHSKVEGANITGSQIAKTRLRNGEWPLYKNTRYRHLIKSGDKVVIYVSRGNESSAFHFIGSGAVKDVQECEKGLFIEPFGKRSPVSAILLEDCEVFTTPIKIRGLLNYLSFIPKNVTNWGYALQGGCRIISADDFELIVSRSENRF